MPPELSVRIRRLELRNYRSIEKSSLDLPPLTFLVGRNGVGKSNILDGLRFISESLQNTLEYAFRKRGGIDQVRRRSLGGRPTNPWLGVEIQTDAFSAQYSFRVAAVLGRSFRVDREHCSVRDAAGKQTGSFLRSDSEVKEWTVGGAAPALAQDRLLLVAASGYPVFRQVFDVLTRMAFHNLNPEVMKDPQRPEPGDRLSQDGRNLASVIKALQDHAPQELERITEYLRAIGVPLTQIRHKHAGALETIEVSQETRIPTGERNRLFDAVSLSDGTLRALGILVSLVSGRSIATGPTLIGIEEPETALHPAAVGALVAAILDAAEKTQIIVTCHSPELLDSPLIDPSMIRAVLLQDDQTVVGPLSDAKSRLMTDHLEKPGDLLKLDQLSPDPESIKRQAVGQGTLFESIL